MTYSHPNLDYKNNTIYCFRLKRHLQQNLNHLNYKLQSFPIRLK